MARKRNRNSGSKPKGWPRIYIGEAAGAPRKKKTSYEWAAAAWVLTVLLLTLGALVWLSLTHPTEPPPTLIVH